MEKNQLSLLREEIDHLDEELKRLILQRKDLVVKVLEFKIENKLEIYSPEREAEILKMMTADISNSDPFHPYFCSIFKTIITENRNYMKQVSK